MCYVKGIAQIFDEDCQDIAAQRLTFPVVVSEHDEAHVLDQHGERQLYDVKIVTSARQKATCAKWRKEEVGRCRGGPSLDSQLTSRVAQTKNKKFRRFALSLKLTGFVAEGVMPLAQERCPGQLCSQTATLCQVGVNTCF